MNGDITNAMTYIDCITTTYNFVNNSITDIGSVCFVCSFLEVKAGWLIYLTSKIKIIKEVFC